MKIMEEKNQCKKNSYFFSSLVFLLIHISFNIITIKSEITYCPKEAPFLVLDECKLQNCTKEDFASGKCIIKNDIIKTQWLNNIIVIGDYDFRYVTFASYPNEDMVIETTSYPPKSTRKFYGIKRNGRPLFIKNSIETPYYTADVGNEVGNFESTSIIVKTTDNKEFFLSISKLECAAEMFNFQTDKILRNKVFKFSGNYYVYSLRHSLVHMTTPDNNKYLFAFIGNENYIYNAYFKEYTFDSYANFRDSKFYKEVGSSDIGYTYGYGISCFETKNRLILCFFIKLKDNNYYYMILKYTTDEKYTIKFNLKDKEKDQSIFYKGIHLKGEVGVFAYYDYVNSSSQIYIIFMEYINGFNNYITNDHKIALNLPNPLNNLLLNDLIKMNENKICFASVPSDRNTIDIVIINLFDNKKIKIRYYSIPSFSLYNYKILLDIRIHAYKNIIAFGSSFCYNEKCEVDGDTHNSSLILFSYPNATDYTLDLEQYLFDNNNISINNLTIDLKDHINRK